MLDTSGNSRKIGRSKTDWLPWLFVIARNSAFTYKGRAVDVKQVAQELGERYVLEGSVRKAGNGWANGSSVAYTVRDTRPKLQIKPAANPKERPARRGACTMRETGPSFQPAADRSEADVTGVFLVIGSWRGYLPLVTHGSTLRDWR